MGFQGILRGLLFRRLLSGVFRVCRLGRQLCRFLLRGLQEKGLHHHAGSEKNQNNGQENLKGVGLLPLTAADSSGHIK